MRGRGERRGLAAPAARVLGRLLAVLAVVALSPSTATAQECEPGGPWPTTEFEVLLTKPFIPSDWLAVANRLAAVEEWLRSTVEESVRSEEVNAGIAAADAEWKRRVEDHLRDIARRYEAAGFGCPEMETVRVDGELRYVAYLVDFSEELVESLRDRPDGTLGYAYPAGRLGPAEPLMRYLGARHWMVVDREPFMGSQTRYEEPHLYRVLAHELFHMIQGTYDVRYGSIRMTDDASDVVMEGGADGAAMYLVSQRFPDYLETREDDPDWLGGFPYYQPFVDALREKSETFGDPYQTMSFWFHLAERYGSLAVIEGLLRHRLEAVSRTGRLMWLEAGLRSGRGFGKGLAELFPHFLTEFASYGESRYAGVSSDEWLDTVLDGCREPSAPHLGKPQEPVEFTLEDQEDARRPYWIMPLAGRCAAAKWTAETEDPPTVALQVEVTGTDREVLDDLHVGLAGSTVRDATCWEQAAGMGPGAKSPCLLDPLGEAFEVDGIWHRIWKVEPGDYADEGEAMVVIARVAEQPWEMEWEGAQIEVRFQLLHEKASMAEGGGGPSGAAVAAPLEIELDQVLLDVVRPYPNDMCLVRFRLKNAETREGVEIMMNHSGPVGSGTYAISAGEEYHAPPEDYPNTFVGGFAVAMGGGRPFEFWFDSGQVEIESIAGRLVEGEVRANGVRRPGYGREGEPTGASVVARFTLTANLHYPGDAREKATGAMALRCLEQRPGPGPGPRPPSPPSEDPPERDDDDDDDDDEEEDEEEDDEEENDREDAPDPEPDAEAESPGRPADAAPRTPSAEGRQAALETARVSIELLPRPQSGGDVESMLKRGERRSGPSGTTFVAEDVSVRFSLPAETEASCDLSGAPSGIANLVRGRAFRANMRIHVGPDGFEMELEPGSGEGTLTFRAGGEAVESSETSRTVRALMTRHDVREAALETLWPGGRAACAAPVRISFQVIEVLP